MELQTRANIILADGGSVIDVMDELQLKYAKAMKLVDAYKAEISANELVEVASSAPALVGEIITTIKEDAEARGIDTSALDEVSEGLVGLEVLNIGIQTTALIALDVAQTQLVNPKLTPAQWKTIVDGLGVLYGNIFVQQGTSINILNNNGSGDGKSEGVAGWKASLR